MLRSSIVVLVLATLAACSGAASVLPGATDASAGAGGSPQLGGDARHRKTLARLTIKVPRRAKTHRLHPKYVSPATESLAYTVDGGARTVVNLTTHNPNCALTGPLGYLQCSIVMNLTAGAHTFSFTTYDAANGSGSVLSANTHVTYTVVTGAPNSIPVTLGGVAEGLLVTPVSTAVSGSQPSGFSIYGSQAVPVEIVPYDIDDNYIIGPGAPQPVVPIAPAAMTMFTPPPTSPNLWFFSSTATATDPTVPSASTLNVRATPVPDSGGNTVAASIPLSLYQPWIYAVNGNSISVYDEEGTPITHTGTFAGLNTPDGITYDPVRSWIYVTNYAANSVTTFDEQGNYAACTGCFSGLDEPSDIAYDSHNGWLYVVNNANSTVKAFDYLGNSEAITAFSDLEFADNIAFDSGNDTLYAGPTTLGGYAAYAESGGAASSAGAMAGLFDPNGAVYDPHDGLIYVADSGTGSIYAYDNAGNLQSLSGSWTGIEEPQHILYDPYNAHLYVTNFTGAVTEYDEEGNEIALSSPITGLETPEGITIVP